MSKLAKHKRKEKEDSTETFGKFTVSELHDIQNTSNDYVFKKAKKRNTTQFYGCMGHKSFNIFEIFTTTCSTFRLI
jgi:hypothetical protein